VRKEGLYNSNILYCGGGHFYLLVPASTIDRLGEYQNEIDKKIYNAFGLDLSVLLGGIKINFSRLLNFDVHDELARLLEQKKNKNSQRLSIWRCSCPKISQVQDVHIVVEGWIRLALMNMNVNFANRL